VIVVSEVLFSLPSVRSPFFVSTSILAPEGTDDTAPNLAALVPLELTGRAADSAV
jgi:hypothetical protein